MRFWSAGALLVAVLFAGSPSLAQTPSAQDRATARLLAEEADKKSEAGDIPGALELFRRADAIFPAPSLKLAIGRLLAKQKQIIEAHELLLDVARSAPQKDEPSVWATAREAARQEAEALAPRIAKIEISLRGLDAGVEPTVTLDGQRVPNESLGVVRPINPGSHIVHVEASGYMPSDQKIQMAEGEHYKLAVKMYREPHDSPVSSGSSGSSIPSRKTRPGSSQDASGGRTLAILGFTSGGVFLAAGSVLGWMVSTRVDDIKKDCTLPNGACPLSRRPDADTAEQMALASNISFGLAVAGLGLGVYGLLSKPGPSSSAKNPPAWRVGVGPGSVAVAGAF